MVKMEPSDGFNLRWEDFGANTRVALKELREETEFLDVTIVAGDGKRVEACKVVLAAGSSFFFKILRENPHPHPLIYLKGVEYKLLSSVLDFLYTGEASIVEEDLKQFLEIAEDLKIKGLDQTKTLNPHQNQGVIEKSSTVPMETHSHSAGSLSPQDHVTAQEPGLSHGISHSHDALSTPHGALSPPHGALSPPHGALSPPHGALSPPHCALSPPHCALSPPHCALSPPHCALSPHGTLSPPHGTLSPPHGPLSPPHGALSPPHGALSPPHGALSPPHGALSPPHGPLSPHGTLSPPHGPLSPPHGALSPPHGALSTPHGVLSPPHGALSPPQDQVAIEKSTPEPWILHPPGATDHLLQGQVTAESFACSHGQISVPQSACEEYHVDVKVEVKDHDFELFTKLNQNEQAIFSVKEEKEETLETCSAMVLSEATDSNLENNEEENSIALAEEQDENIERDIRNVHDKEETLDWNGNTADAEELQSEFTKKSNLLPKSNSQTKHLNADGISNDSTKLKLKEDGESPFYEVTCKESRGEFHQEKFISGAKGDCIFFNGTWMTPNEFERSAGSRAKKYKQSLRVNGKRIEEVIIPNGNRHTTSPVRLNSKDKKGNKRYSKLNMDSIKMQLDKKYESAGACSTFDSNRDEFLNTGDDITSDDEIDLSGTPVTMALQDNTANLDESYTENIVRKDGTSNMDDSDTEDAVLIDLDDVDNYRSPIGSRTRIKQITDNDVPEIVDLEQFEKEINRCNESTVKRDNAHFSNSQTSGLRKAFKENNFMSKEKAPILSQELGLTEKQIRIWFNNSRAKERTIKMKKILGEIRKYSCESCSRSFVNKSTFTKHMSSHDSRAFQKDKTNGSGVRHDGTT